MKFNYNKRGFTLIEVLVSITLISILSLGFLQAMVGFLGITKKNIAYDEATTAFSRQIDANENLGAAEAQETINLGNGHSIVLDQYSIEDSQSEDIFIYYKYK